MSVPLVVFLSTVVLHSVSAGGVYCAKTARARAAALGLDYPGEDGAPDLSGPPHYGMDLQPYSDSYPDLDKTQPSTAYYWENPPELSSVDTMPYHAHHDGFESSAPNFDPYEQSLSHFEPEPVQSFPSGWFDSNHKPPFVEVKHEALPTPAAAPSQADLVEMDPPDHNKPLFFVYNEHVRDADESAPNRHGMSVSGIPLPQSEQPTHDQKGLGGVPESVEIIDIGHTAPKKSQSPVVGSRGKPRYPNQFARYPKRSSSPKPFPQGNPHLRGLFKPKLSPVRRKFNSN